MAEPDNSAMRASDADREAIAERLHSAMNEGRLNLSEYDERLGRAYAAVTYGELAHVTSDLPAAAPPAEPPRQEPAKQNHRAKTAKEWRDWAGTSFVLVGVWGFTSLMAQEPTHFWPIYPMAIWAIILLAGTVFGFGGGTSCGGSTGNRQD